ncbi:hypothetical protein J6590_028616 [Homalodisca vitripennis]|nr:hypothetical protein J6590_028616 [Homalodisca vitripennis]
MITLPQALLPGSASTPPPPPNFQPGVVSGVSKISDTEVPPLSYYPLTLSTPPPVILPLFGTSQMPALFQVNFPTQNF